MKDVLELDLFKEIVDHYTVYYHLQPLTAKIYALLVFNNCQNGLTFDDLVEIFEVSKSSVSHSVNTLIELNFIEQLKRENERKRFFRVNRNLFLMRLEDVQKRLEREKYITQELQKYRKEHNACLFNHYVVNLYLSHLDEATISILKTIDNLKLHIRNHEK